MLLFIGQCLNAWKYCHQQPVFLIPYKRYLSRWLHLNMAVRCRVEVLRFLTVMCDCRDKSLINVSMLTVSTRAKRSTFPSPLTRPDFCFSVFQCSRWHIMAGLSKDAGQQIDYKLEANHNSMQTMCLSGDYQSDLSVCSAGLSQWFWINLQIIFSVIINQTAARFISVKNLPVSSDVIFSWTKSQKPREAEHMIIW